MRFLESASGGHDIFDFSIIRENFTQHSPQVVRNSPVPVANREEFVHFGTDLKVLASYEWATRTWPVHVILMFCTIPPVPFLDSRIPAVDLQTLANYSPTIIIGLNFVSWRGWAKFTTEVRGRAM